MLGNPTLEKKIACPSPKQAPSSLAISVRSHVLSLQALTSVHSATISCRLPTIS